MVRVTGWIEHPMFMGDGAIQTIESWRPHIFWRYYSHPVFCGILKSPVIDLEAAVKLSSDQFLSHCGHVHSLPLADRHA